MNILFDVGMAVGPVIGYIYQYRLIQLKQTVGTFSIDICGILLFANIMRLNFYIFKRYQLALLFQSLIMITVQLLLLRLCAQLPLKNVQADMAEPKSQEPQYNEVQQQFWRWKQFKSYFFTVFLFTTVTFSISFLFFALNFKIYGELVGIVSLLSQSILIAPQIIKNFRMGKVKGLSHLLVMLNWSGDIIKLIYFLIKNQPFQFVMCGIIQIILDTTVIGQIIFYKSKEKRKRGEMSPKKKVKVNFDTEDNGNSRGSMELPPRQLNVKISDKQYQTQMNLTVKNEDVQEEMNEEENSSITQELSHPKYQETSEEVD